MSTDNSQHAELQKLKHFLQVEDESSFSFLQKLNKDEVHELRMKIIEVSQFTQTDIWKRLSGVANFFPNYMNAKIAQTVLGPLIAANMSYYMTEKDAIAIMKNMSTSFLATVSEYMIPEKAVNLINQIPIDILKKVTIELVRDKKYLTAAGFVDVSDIARLIELSKVIYNEEDLIRISMYVENKSYIAKIVERFTDDKLEKIIKKAYQENLQDEILSVFVQQSSNEVQRILRIINELPEQLKTKVIKDFENRIQNHGN